MTARGHVAFWTGQAGNRAAARDEFAVLLPIREQMSGPEHPDTLYIRQEVARWDWTSGRHKPNSPCAAADVAPGARVEVSDTGAVEAE